MSSEIINIGVQMGETARPMAATKLLDMLPLSKLAESPDDFAEGVQRVSRQRLSMTVGKDDWG